MDLRSEAPAVIGRLRTTASDTHMREFAFVVRKFASMLLELVADLILMELLMKIRPKLQREFHKIVEVLGSLTFAGTFGRRTCETTSFPVLASFLSLCRTRRSRKSKHVRTTGSCELFLIVPSR